MTELDNLIAAACLVETERRRLTSLRKVSAKGFVRDARLLAGEPDDEKVAALKAKLEASRGLLPMLVRRLAVFITADTCPTLPAHRDRLEKMFRIHWLEGVDSELTDLGLTRWDVLLLATLRATETHGDRFGSIDDWARHQDALAKATDKLNDLIAAMRTAYNARDVLMQKPPLPALDIYDVNRGDKEGRDALYRERLARERAARSELPGPWLIKFPTISLADPAWPTKVIEQAMIGMPAETEAKPAEDEDARLAKKAKRAARDRASKSKPKSAKSIKRKRPDPQVIGPLSSASSEL